MTELAAFFIGMALACLSAARIAQMSGLQRFIAIAIIACVIPSYRDQVASSDPAYCSRGRICSRANRSRPSNFFCSSTEGR